MSEAITLREELRHAISTLRTLRGKRVLVYQERQDAEYNLAGCRAYTLVSGLDSEGRAIRDLKPEAVRDAVLSVTLDQNANYQGYRSNLHTVERELAMVDADIEQWVNTISAVKGEMRLRAAELAVEE